MHALMVSTPVNPLFEPGAPPPALPLLTSQIPLIYDLPAKLTPSAEEELQPNSRTNMTRPGRQLYSSTSRNSALKSRPCRCFSFMLKRSRSPSVVSDDSQTSDISQVSDVSDFSVEETVFKPRGECGRPGRGGYKLESALNWSPASFNLLKVTPILHGNSLS
jgi:hypothetical protein